MLPTHPPNKELLSCCVARLASSGNFFPGPLPLQVWKNQFFYLHLHLFFNIMDFANTNTIVVRLIVQVCLNFLDKVYLVSVFPPLMVLDHHRLFSNIYVTTSENFRHREKPRDQFILLILQMWMLRFRGKRGINLFLVKEELFC